MSTEAGLGIRAAWTKFLRQVPFFSGLDATGLALIAEACVRRELPARSSLFFEGESGYCLYVIVRGSVQIRKEATPTPLVVAERGVGEVIGELALLDGKPRSATAITLRSCVLYELSRERFLQCIQRRPELALGMLSVLTQRLRQADDRATHRLKPLDVRLAALLLEKAQGTSPGPAGTLPLGRLVYAELGRTMGVARETVSRQFALWESQELVQRTDGRTVLLNPVALERLAQQR
jgi:CRP/FNR family transcriptional regulator, cyclic AMP receptor protein